MHVGHITSDDLMGWEEEDIVLYPGEGDLTGFMPGSAFASDGKLWLFYTYIKDGNECINCAVSDDGRHFRDRAMASDLISPFEDKRYMRHPFVFDYEGTHKLIACASEDGIGRVVIYDSEDLINWEYKGIAADVPQAAWSAGEMPEIYQMEDIWVLSLQTARAMPHKCLYCLGDFDGYKFISEGDFFALEMGSNIESQRTCLAPDGRRLQTAWMYDPRNNTACFAATRQIQLDIKGNLTLVPAEELEILARKESPFVEYEAGRLNIRFENKTIRSVPYATEPEIRVLEDVGIVEVFINGGREVLSLYVC